MSESAFQHSEAFLQWIWENLLFDVSGLKTTCGRSLNIVNAGRLNTSNGPDFKHGAIEINGLQLHGDIELHTKAVNWNHHGHQEDANFNSVILHVVADSEAKEVFCKDSSSPYTLNLLPYLSKELHLFLKNFESSEMLPCASAVHVISEEVFLRQIQKAHEEYFEKKANDFFHFYDPELLPSRAWKQALIISLWDGLGISHNRSAMQKVAVSLLSRLKEREETTLQQALTIAGLGTEKSDIQWNMKSVRPSNHPKTRIKEAVQLSNFILKQPFEDFLSTDSLELWNQWFRESALRKTNRFKILFGTVFLPSLYILGNLYAHAQLSEAAFSKWLSLKTPIPASLLSKFKTLNLKDKDYRKKLGAVHQIKSYCNTGSCSECLVLKKAILS